MYIILYATMKSQADSDLHMSGFSFCKTFWDLSKGGGGRQPKIIVIMWYQCMQLHTVLFQSLWTHQCSIEHK